MAWDRLATLVANVPVAQAAVWDRLATRLVDIKVATAPVGWNKLATKSVAIQPAVVIPGAWDRLDSKSVTIQPTAPPPAQYTLQVVVSPTNAGSVLVEPTKTYYNSGDIVKLTATAKSGYVFDYWDADGKWLDNKSPLTITIRASQKITAHFRTGGTPPTPPPKEEGGIPIGLIIGGVVLIGGVAIAAGAKRKRRK